MVGKLHVPPSLATIDGETSVLLVATGHVTTDKVRHSLLSGRTERELGRLGRLEKNLGLAVSVQLAGGISSSFHVVTIVKVGPADGLDGVSPGVLSSQDFLLGDNLSLFSLRSSSSRCELGSGDTRSSLVTEGSQECGCGSTTDDTSSDHGENGVHVNSADWSNRTTGTSTGHRSKDTPCGVPSALRTEGTGDGSANASRDLGRGQRGEC
mmetsp:Transcript_14091/g.22336  ORF Transcript_14091/g.22336 Transcript_14091/m.22336 type:complete len:210 (-) Transcript_14091:84-713(-)